MEALRYCGFMAWQCPCSTDLRAPHSAIQGTDHQTNTGRQSGSNTKTSSHPEKESETASLCLSLGQTSYPNSFPEPGSWLSLNQWVEVISHSPQLLGGSHFFFHEIFPFKNCLQILPTRTLPLIRILCTRPSHSTQWMMTPELCILYRCVFCIWPNGFDSFCHCWGEWQRLIFSSLF